MACHCPRCSWLRCYGRRYDVFGVSTVGPTDWRCVVVWSCNSFLVLACISYPYVSVDAAVAWTAVQCRNAQKEYSVNRPKKPPPTPMPSGGTRLGCGCSTTPKGLCPHTKPPCACVAGGPCWHKDGWVKKLQKRRMWAIMLTNGRLSTVINDNKGELQQHCGAGEKVVRVEVQEIRT